MDLFGGAKKKSFNFSILSCLLVLLGGVFLCVMWLAKINSSQNYDCLLLNLVVAVKRIYLLCDEYSEEWGRKGGEMTKDSHIIEIFTSGGFSFFSPSSSSANSAPHWLSLSLSHPRHTPVSQWTFSGSSHSLRDIRALCTYSFFCGTIVKWKSFLIPGQRQHHHHCYPLGQKRQYVVDWGMQWLKKSHFYGMINLGNEINSETAVLELLHWGLAQPFPTGTGNAIVIYSGDEYYMRDELCVVVI